ncbi:MAG: DEAD/DEAH box helicase [Pseudomonadota bacterium]
MSFESLGLHAALLRAIADAGYGEATEVQAQAIPPALQGRDLRVSSSTGSGKTASFALPALQRVLDARGEGSKRREKGVVHGPRVLVLTPTRELALQVAKATMTYGRHVQGLRVATVVGGVPYGAQLKALRGPLDILIATPGRLIDHLGQGKAVLANVEMLVLDEADRMLDMGFIEDIHHIAAATPAQRQTVMYSATFAGHVGRLAQELLADDAQTIAVASHTDAHANIEQRLHWADNLRHKDAILEHLLTERAVEQAVVFTSTQQQAEGLAERLADMGHAVAALHGGMPQGRRNRVLQGLRQRQLRVLVATDVAARGIDVPTVSHVINYGLPMKPEDYVHRIGRTGRAGRSGLAVTLAERRDLLMIKRIQQFTTQQIPVAKIAGLEPRQPEPQIFAGRPQRNGPEGFRPSRPARPARGRQQVERRR